MEPCLKGMLQRWRQAAGHLHRYASMEPCLMGMVQRHAMGFEFAMDQLQWSHALWAWCNVP